MATRRRRRNGQLPPIGEWNTYAGGTFAAPNKNSYDIRRDGQTYSISPYSAQTNSNRHLGYIVSVYPGVPARGHHQLGRFRKLSDALKAAKAFHQDKVLVASTENPPKAAIARAKKKLVRMLADNERARIVAVQGGNGDRVPALDRARDLLIKAYEEATGEKVHESHRRPKLRNPRGNFAGGKRIVSTTSTVCKVCGSKKIFKGTSTCANCGATGTQRTSKKANPLRFLHFKKYSVKCDGKTYGPYATKREAKKNAELITRVCMKPAAILGHKR